MTPQEQKRGLPDALGLIVGLLAAVWATWGLVVAFKGGHIPLTPVRFYGASVGRGIVYLLIGEPILLTVAWGVSLVAAGLLAGLLGLVRRP